MFIKEYHFLPSSLMDETTERHLTLLINNKWVVRTGIVPANCGLHDCFHPLTHNQLLLRAETVCLVCLVDNSETIASRIDFLVRYDLVASDVDIPLDFRLLPQGL